jgi:serine protease
MKEMDDCRSPRPRLRGLLWVVLAFVVMGPVAVAGAAEAGGSGSTTGAPASPSAAATIATTTPAADTPAPSPLAADVRNNELLVRLRGDGKLRRIKLKAGLDPVAVARTLRANTGVIQSAGANLVAHAAAGPAWAAQATTPTTATTTPTTPVATSPVSTTPVVTPTPVSGSSMPPSSVKGWLPDDHVGVVPWTSLQWNFIGRWGVNASQAWANLRTDPSRAGGRGAIVAVVDSGIAYRTQGDYVASPDLPRDRILPGYDFVDEDRFPDDRSGHGTHVASTIAGATGNNAGVTGLAYETKILPVRVLDEKDAGDVLAIARGIRYAIKNGADIINLSADFPVSASASDIPEVMAAIFAAKRAGILVVSSSGNDGVGKVALPARSSAVLSVGATTGRGCRSTYSNAGPDLDLVAPGGGTDHRGEPDDRCRPGQQGPPIAQVTLLRAGVPGKLGVPLDYFGTSMAAAHVSGVAALVYGSGILGKHPRADLLGAYLVRSTRDLGPRGHDARYGAGLIDAAKATNRKKATASVRGAKRASARAASSRSLALPL